MAQVQVVKICKISLHHNLHQENTAARERKGHATLAATQAKHLKTYKTNLTAKQFIGSVCVIPLRVLFFFF